jgi:hypothetical protein
MNAFSPEQPQQIDEDLQIVHATLAAIVGDVERYSGAAARAVTVAMVQVNEAHHAMVEARQELR